MIKRIFRFLFDTLSLVFFVLALGAISMLLFYLGVKTQ